MGLLKAVLTSVQETLDNQYKEYFYCDSLDNHVLLKRGQFHQLNNHLAQNVISDGSMIVVNAGQGIIVVENGKVIDVSLEEGVYIWNTSTTPSIFNEDDSESISKSIDETLRKVSFGGIIAKDQRIYYVNMKEIINNKFGSLLPIPYNDPKYLSIYIKYYGVFSFKVVNPIVLYENIIGNIKDEYLKDNLVEMCMGEFYAALDTALTNLGAGGEGLQFNEIPTKQRELSKLMSHCLDDDWIKTRGIQIQSVGIIKVTPDQKSQLKIDKRDEELFKRDDMSFYDMQSEMDHSIAVEANHDTWVCPQCQIVNDGNFCKECGMKRDKKIYCRYCGTKVEDGKYCSHCGSKIE